MNKVALLIIFSGIIVAIASVGADFRYFREDRGVKIFVVADDQGLVSLKPIQPYAYMENGELVIRFDAKNPGYSGYGMGVGPESRYVFDKVFCISNRAWSGKRVAVELEVREPLKNVLRVYSPESPENRSPEESSDRVRITVDRGEEVCVGFVIDTSALKLGSYSGEVSIKASEEDGK